MANHKSAAKRARQTVRKTARKSQTKKTARTSEKKLLSAIASKQKDEAIKLLVVVTSRIDKAAQKGVLHANTAARKISRLSKRVQALAK